MPRAVDEWIGKDADTPTPTRVKVRVFFRADGRCQICSRKLNSGDKWEVDHQQALCNGGANRESNLQILCEWCHAAKTAKDVSEKARTYAARKRHLGVKSPSRRPMPGGRNSEFKKKISGEVVRR